MSAQAPGAVVMIRPHHFEPNPATELDNAFQAGPQGRAAVELARTALAEVDAAIARLRDEGVTVHAFDDDIPGRPDSVFPNNWLSTHGGGHVAIFPMFTPNRRTERRYDIVEFLKHRYRVQDVIDYSGLEHDGIFLEGTGAMVLDHVHRLAYVCRSNRADPIALERFCTNFGFEPMAFDAADEFGTPIYHTNVLMCIATEFALIGAEAITAVPRRTEVLQRLAEHGREVIELTHEQVREFAGNAMELSTPSGRILALSTRALQSLTDGQRDAIERSCRIVALDVPTIELAGGSVRCMLAGVHLDARPAG